MGYHDLFNLDKDIQLGFASLDITYLDGTNRDMP